MLLIVLNGFYVAAEFALVAVDRTKVDVDESSGRQMALVRTDGVSLQERVNALNAAPRVYAMQLVAGRRFFFTRVASSCGESESTAEDSLPTQDILATLVEDAEAEPSGPIEAPEPRALRSAPPVEPVR